MKYFDGNVRIEFQKLYYLFVWPLLPIAMPSICSCLRQNMRDYAFYFLFLTTMGKHVLDMKATKDSFFEDTAMIGIAAAQPGYRFCWILNNYFDIDFTRDPAQDIPLQKADRQKNITKHNFPLYQYDLPNCNHKYLLYKLKDGNESLLPETKHLDYLWLVQTANYEEDALNILNQLKNIPDVQLAQILVATQLKSMINLLV